MSRAAVLGSRNDILFGGAGAWAYQNYLAPRLNPQQPEARQPVAQEPIEPNMCGPDEGQREPPCSEP